jgi:hypothetical protein
MVADLLGANSWLLIYDLLCKTESTGRRNVSTCSAGTWQVLYGNVSLMTKELFQNTQGKSTTEAQKVVWRIYDSYFPSYKFILYDDPNKN